MWREDKERRSDAQTLFLLLKEEVAKNKCKTMGENKGTFGWVWRRGSTANKTMGAMEPPVKGETVPVYRLPPPGSSGGERRIVEQQSLDVV